MEFWLDVPGARTLGALNVGKTVRELQMQCDLVNYSTPISGDMIAQWRHGEQ